VLGQRWNKPTVVHTAVKGSETKPVLLVGAVIGCCAHQQRYAARRTLIGNASTKLTQEPQSRLVCLKPTSRMP
jgi:hypothetical protein